MGIPNFLSHIISCAGREVDLQDYSTRKEPLRVAIDASSWIHRACFTYSDVLADEKHLNNYGRSILQYEEQQKDALGIDAASSNNEVLEFIAKSCQTVMENVLSFQKATNTEILIVLDGTTPPIKAATVTDRGVKRGIEQVYRDLPVDKAAQSPLLERRFKANRRTGAGEHYTSVVEAVIIALRSEKIPFLVAPYEADAQLAFLQLNGYVDLVVTEDSDLIAYGLFTPLLYRWSRNSQGCMSRGVLLRRDDLSAMFDFNVQKNSIDLTDFTPSMLACLFACLGCDYCCKLRGIGLSLACRDIRAAFFPKDASEYSPLERLMNSLFKSTWDRTKLSDDDKDAYERDFLAAVFMYRHAMIYDPIEARCKSMIAFRDADKELTSFGPYAAILRNELRASSIIGCPFPPIIASHIAEGWICPKSLKLRNIDMPAPSVQNDLDIYISEIADSNTRYRENEELTQPEIFSPKSKSISQYILESQN
jgi:5'-3' exonuclease